MTMQRRSGLSPSSAPRRRPKRLVFCADLDAVADDAPLWGGAARLDEAEAREGEALRDALVLALTSKQREVIEMHFFEGLSQGEIARRLGVSQQVVQKRLHGDRREGKLVGGALPRLREALAGRFARS
jgi:RNA polymerase sigma factor (sigma-70 family)